MPEPYYERDGIVIYCADCRDVLPLLPTDSIVMDPPYGIGFSTNHKVDGKGASWIGTEIANDDGVDLRDFILDQMPPDMPIVCFGSWKAPRPRNIRGVLIWDKGPAFGMGDLSFPWKLSWEEIYVFGPGFSGHRDEGVLKGFTSVSWESKGRCHPNEKPVSLLRHIIGKMESQEITDPFMGSGSTLLAARDLGRRAIGIEIEERYCEIAAKRLQQSVMRFEVPA